MILVTVKDGYSGKTTEVQAHAVGEENRIYFIGQGINYWSGAVADMSKHGANQITLPIRRLTDVLGFRVV